MKQFLSFLLFLSAIYSLNAQTLKVAIWETKCSDGSITKFQSVMVRGGMETAVANAAGFTGYDRAAFDEIVKEHNFQRSGAVSESEIKRLGEMAGVQYVIVPEAMADGNDFYIIVKMLDVESGEFGAAYEELCATSASDIKKACAKLGEKLFGASSVTSDIIWSWRNALAKATDNVTATTDGGGKHIGNTDEPGLVLQYMADGSLYCGGYGYSANDATVGMFFAADGFEISNCPGGWVYAGKYRNGLKDGEGFVYNRNGQLVYFGNFENDAPTDTYPGSYPDLSALSFNILMMPDGSIYSGEMINGNSEGMGLYLWPDGDAWFGFWEGGKQNGMGIQMDYLGSYTYGIWKDGQYEMTLEEAEKKRQEEEKERIRKEKESIHWSQRVCDLVANAKSKQILPDGSIRIGDTINGLCLQISSNSIFFDWMYVGHIKKGQWTDGMLVMSDYADITNCDNGWVYVGQFKNGIKHDKHAKVYDHSGKLVYSGAFQGSYDAPAYPYPSPHLVKSGSSYTFVVTSTGGDKYIGVYNSYQNKLYKSEGLVIYDDNSALFAMWYYDSLNGMADAIKFKSDGEYEIIPKEK